MDFRRWAADLSRPFTELLDNVAGYLPDLFSALVLLVLGWLVARLIRFWVAGIIARTGRWIPGLRDRRALEEAGVERLASQAVSGLVFWLILLFFMAAAAETLGMPVLTSGLTSLGRYLPSVVAAVLIFVAGLVIGNLTRAAVAGAAASAGLQHAELLGQAAKVAILIVAVLVALDQIGIDSVLLVYLTTTIVGVTVAGAALAFGFGARTAVSNIIASHYLVRNYRVGQRVRVGSVEGRILEFQSTSVVFDTPEGRVMVPAKEFSETSSILLSGGSDGS